jgi:hypothetical protein
MSGSNLPDKRSLFSIKALLQKKLTLFSRSIEIQFHMLNGVDHDDVRTQTAREFSFAIPGLRFAA